MKYQIFDWTKSIKDLKEDARTLAIDMRDDFVTNI